MKENITEELIDLRHQLHRYPELSGREGRTAQTLASFLRDNAPPDEMVEKLGGDGLLAVYEGKEEGASILFRCELDALPIEEKGIQGHASEHEGISHKCGHDGHMTILTGLGVALSKKRPEKGRVLLLYQPAEETGEGAERVLRDPRFAPYMPDKAYALHNLPGYPAGSIVTKSDVFAAASKGKEVFLYGRTSHAGEPQNGISPALAMADIVKQFFFLSQRESFEDFVLATVIHAGLGSISFGTSPGEAEVRVTLRTFREDDMNFLTKKAEEIASQEGRANELLVRFDEKEVFPASVNDEGATRTVKDAAVKAGLEHLDIQTPFKWSEDFGHFLHQCPGALFGLGSGEQQPDLHNPDFDFPDRILEQGVRIFEEVARSETEG